MEMVSWEIRKCFFIEIPIGSEEKGIKIDIWVESSNEMEGAILNLRNDEQGSILSARANNITKVPNLWHTLSTWQSSAGSTFKMIDTKRLWPFMLWMKVIVYFIS